MDSLFDKLDCNQDGRLSRSELHTSAHHLGWHWAEAPLFAVLDLLTIPNPISKQRFHAYMQEMGHDPLGPYGRVLLHTAHFKSASKPQDTALALPRRRPAGKSAKNADDSRTGCQKRVTSADASNGDLIIPDDRPPVSVTAADAALLIIDPQHSFTGGVWKESIGINAAAEVAPIVHAFHACRSLLQRVYHHADIMFTRCPFPPDSYGWDKRLADVLAAGQIYVIKPGNSVLFPPLNGFRRWIENSIARGKRVLVIGGCTLNSCVRVSAIETQARYQRSDLQVVVDLSLCGARSSNYRPNPQFDSRSAVASAIEQMTASGVRVVRRVEWELFDEGCQSQGYTARTKTVTPGE